MTEGEWSHVELHDEFGFAGLDPEEEDIVTAAVTSLNLAIEYSTQADRPTVREIIETYVALRNETEDYHEELVRLAHKGAGALVKHSGTPELPRIEDIDEVDREAYFAMYPDDFPNSPMLTEMQLRDGQLQESTLGNFVHRLGIIK